MNKPLQITGFLSTIVLILVIPIYALMEPIQQEEIRQEFQALAVSSATDIYAENCVVCHGPTGEGIAEFPALNTEGLRSMPPEELFKVVARGRDNTQMAAWGVEEGGVLSNSQIEELITFIQYADWQTVQSRVAELGLTPPELTTFEVSDEMFDLITSLPNGAILAEGMTIYAETCSACHAPNGSGTALAPALNSEEVRAKPFDDLYRTVSLGVPGTLMAGWENALTQEEIVNVLTTITSWPEIEQAGIEFPEATQVVIPSTPEMIADGRQLFQIACKTCHGVEAFGSPMAPALNDPIFLSETPDAAIYQIISGGVPQTLMPAWGSRLNEYDIQSLVAYLRSLR